MSQQFDPQGHYFVQRRRRFSLLDDWRARRRSFAPGANLRLEHSPTRNARVGVLVGEEAGVPMQVIDARIIEVAPRSVTSTHRHAHDAILFVLEGSGTTEIGGETCRWSRWDTLHTPAMTWHRHRNDSDHPARLLAVADAPLVAGFGLSRVEDIGDEAPRADDPALAPRNRAGSAYERELVAAARSWDARGAARHHTKWSEVTLTQNPKGSRSALLVDRSLGYRTTGLSLAMFEIPPGQAQARHLHPGEAILYIVDGEGYSDVGDERIRWKTGDAAIVNHYVWHQHFNGSTERTATVIRMHMWESVMQMMQLTMDPVPLYEDEPELEKRMTAGEDRSMAPAAKRKA